MHSVYLRIFQIVYLHRVGGATPRMMNGESLIKLQFTVDLPTVHEITDLQYNIEFRQNQWNATSAIH